jgi:hypothetical protein
LIEAGVDIDFATVVRYGLMFHSFDYPDEIGENKLAIKQAVLMTWRY